MSSAANKRSPRGGLLSEADIQRIAQATADLILLRRVDADPEMGRRQAAQYCSLSVREFDRERLRYPEVLTPARTQRPVLFRRSTLDVYRARRAGLKVAV